MNCRYCSTELPEGAMFCGECGRAVSSRLPGAGRTSAAVDATPEPASLPEPEASATPVPELEPVDADLEPADARAPDEAPELDAPLEPVDAPESESESDDRCSHCGTPLAVTDIFCGECGMVRRSVVARRASDTAVLDPFPWGRPRDPTIRPSADVPAPLVAPKSPDPDALPVDGDTDETRLVDRTAKGERFVLQFSTGESVSVSGTGLLGRNPVAEPGEYFDHTIAIVDPGKSVSKTHLEFGQDAGAFWVSDRYSGNGTVLREPDRPARRCDPGKRYRVMRGSRVEIGEQFFIVS